MTEPIIYRTLGRVDYARSYAAMSRFTSTRDADTADEFWYVQHPPVYTLGMAGKREHLLDTGAVPVIQTDRGGQVITTVPARW